jgi:hypothetical protein
MTAAQFTTLAEVEAAHLAGKTVHWKNAGYTVKVDCDGDFIVVCFNGSACILRKHNPSDFFTA